MLYSTASSSVGPAQLLQHFLRDQFGFSRRFGGLRLQPLQNQHKFVAAQAATVSLARTLE